MQRRLQVASWPFECSTTGRRPLTRGMGRLPVRQRGAFESKLGIVGGQAQAGGRLDEYEY
jgi:hypothetical protein